MPFIFNKKLAKNFFFYQLGNIIPGLLSFLLIPFIVRNYGAAVYAGYSLLFNCMAVVAMFCYSWPGQSYMRFYAKHFQSEDAVYTGLLKKSMLAGAIFFIILSFFITDESPAYLFITLPAFFICCIYNFNLIRTQAIQAASKVAIAEILRTIIMIAIPLSVSFFSKDYALTVLFISLIVAYSCSTLVLSKRRNIFPENNLVNPGDVNKIETGIKQYGLPISFFVSISLALSVNDRYLIAHLFDYNTAGKYAAVYDLLNKGANFACTPILVTFFPHVVKQFNDGDINSAYRNLKRAMLIEVAIFFAGLICLALFGKYFLEVIIKEPVTDSTIYLAYIIYTGVFMTQFAMLVHKPLELRLQTKYMAIIVFIVFIINIIANWILLNKYKDVMIAAWTTLASSLLYIFFVLFVVFKRNNSKDIEAA